MPKRRRKLCYSSRCIKSLSTLHHAGDGLESCSTAAGRGSAAVSLHTAALQTHNLSRMIHPTLDTLNSLTLFYFISSKHVKTNQMPELYFWNNTTTSCGCLTIYEPRPRIFAATPRHLTQLGPAAAGSPGTGESCLRDEMHLSHPTIRLWSHGSLPGYKSPHLLATTAAAAAMLLRIINLR